MTGWPQGYGLKRFDEIDSTNEEARRLAEAGESGPLWITAARQTAGRGRRGRTWEVADGNLAATLLLRPGSAARRMGAAFLRRGHRRRPTWRRISRPMPRIALKWPNDVLADGRKLAGILLETAHGPPRRLPSASASISRTIPTDTEFPATSLAALGAEPPSRGRGAGRARGRLREMV